MDKDAIWQEALTILLEGVSEDDARSVFLNLLVPFGIFGDQFILLAQNAQVESWVKRYYLEEMKQAVSIVSGTQFNIGIQSRTSIETQHPQTPSTQAPPSMTSSFKPIAPSEYLPVSTQDSQPDWLETYINPGEFTFTPPPPRPAARPAQNDIVSSEDKTLFNKCTFDSFVVGKSNEFARGAALAVAEQPGVAYNPLFIYGNSGLGKTHLLVAIANYTRQNYPNLATRYVSANTFLSDYVDSTQHNEWSSFNAKYHQADILLVDDVQYLEGKDETINQLFNIFNEMTVNSKQIVLSADRAPKDIAMDERMRTRFVQGLLADIKAPDYETRLAILKNFLSRVEETTPFYAVIPDSVLTWLAQTSTSNIREIEGAITRLVGHMTLGKHTDLTVDEAKEILQDFFPDTAKKQVSIAAIQSEVERFFGVSHEDLISSKRAKVLTYPRHIAIYLSRYLTEETLETIGKKFGNRDHTTVMYSLKKIEKDQKNNRVLFDQIEQLTIRIKERS